MGKRTNWSVLLFVLLGLGCADTTEVDDLGIRHAEPIDASPIDGGPNHALTEDVGSDAAIAPECSGFEECLDPSRPLCAQMTSEAVAAEVCSEGLRVGCVPAASGCVCTVGPSDRGSTRRAGLPGLMCFG